MNNSFLVLLMLFLHVIDDFRLQGILANMKQKEWWQKNASDRLYRFDYLMALLIHGFSWTFMIMLPIAVKYGFVLDSKFLVAFGLNILVHCGVDTLKCNFHIINLITDQSIHIVQILITAAILL